ncbi:MAG: radical SAM family heme chaperone HemW [Firmicutes bacterium]|nr:radical SAM family heme chaperone HemW [Bacillota bacterium]
MTEDHWGLYVHIPFCLRKCPYCDFNSYPRSRWSREDRRRYVGAVARELGGIGVSCAPVSLYFGGGTPTTLPPQDLAWLLGLAKDKWNLGEEVEISIEANPDTVDGEVLQELRNAGFNRLSLGVQSLRDRDLAILGRSYDVQTVHRALQDARLAGFTNIGVDLIYGIPGQSPQDWRETLEGALELEVEHISCYSLQVEDHTPMAAAIMRGELALPPEDDWLEMFQMTVEILGKGGYEHYEIANFARPGRQCRHNLLYWKNRWYLGVGAGAHSHWERRRWANVKDPGTYADLVAAGMPAVEDERSLTEGEEMDETAFLGLRLLGGVDLGEYRRRFGRDLGAVYADPIAQLTARGLLEQADGQLRLTTRGLPVANVVFAQFIRD